MAVVAPESTGWTTFAITDTTIALLTITLLTTPVQAVGEELIYRSVVLPAAASWVRAVRPALAVGIVVSALGFAAVHGSTDPWLAGHFIVVAVSTGLTAIISGGMEAPIAFHVVLVAVNIGMVALVGVYKRRRRTAHRPGSPLHPGRDRTSTGHLG